MKKDLRMNAKSPDPDDLANEEPPRPDADDIELDGRLAAAHPRHDFSAPHIPPLERGRIKGEE
jgi:hypothetical protein